MSAEVSLQKVRLKALFRSPVMIAACLIIILVLTGVIVTFVREYLHRVAVPTQKSFSL